MDRTLCILGSTGSIGTQSLEVAAHLGIRVVCLAAGRNVKRLEEQARRFLPSLVALDDENAAADLRLRIRDTSVKVLAGNDGVLEAASFPKADTVVSAVTGLAGLAPTMAAIGKGRRLCLAGKESLVCAGKLLMEKAESEGCEILPVDSEHSAIFQCIQDKGGNAPERLVLTASGGPFFGWSSSSLESVTPEMALVHPNWSMGSKITLDSATMVNKGLECIEACALFRVPADRIDVIVHRQSIIHSMAIFADGSTLAQLGMPDMRIPIQYAFTYPERLPSLVPPPDWAATGKLTFDSLDEEVFPAVRLAKLAMSIGGTAPAVFNGAAEEASALFMRGKIRFPDISRIVQEVLETSPMFVLDNIEIVYTADGAARERAAKLATHR